MNSMKPIDLSGLKIGRWTVVRMARQKDVHGHIKWICRCECGVVKSVKTDSLNSGRSMSCGCLQREAVSRAAKTHGMSKTLMFTTWIGILHRCNCKTSRDYPKYGGRGIKVCERWANSFENFMKDMGPKPSRLHSLDRFPDNNGPYSPENCRWATPKEQNNNTRTNRILTLNGESKTVTQWSECLGIVRSTIFKRLAMGWSDEKALSTKLLCNQYG